jgi:PQQ-like domain
MSTQGLHPQDRRDGKQDARQRFVAITGLLVALGLVVAVFLVALLTGAIPLATRTHTPPTPLPTTPATALATTTPTSGLTAQGPWPTYLGDLGRSGFNGSESTLNPVSAPSLRPQWKIASGDKIVTQPVMASGEIYWGSWDGYEHAATLDGKLVWSTFIGKFVDPSGYCNTPRAGVSSTATYTTLTVNGVMTPVLLVGGGNTQFYALNANTGAIIWHRQIASYPSHFLWSSPAYYNGSVYEGISSYLDCPLIQGQLVQMDATTGATQHTFNTVPDGCTGASVWGSPTLDVGAGRVYVVTGNGGSCSTYESNAVALVELTLPDLQFVARWQVPAAQNVADGDFGSTPTLFTATFGRRVRNLVGVVNKNGIYYAFDRANIAAGPLWEDRIAVGGDYPRGGTGAISPSAWDGSTLYLAGGITTIHGVNCSGSLRAVNPATGAFLWERCLGGYVLGAVSAVPGVAVVGAGSSVVAVDTWSGNILYQYAVPSGGVFWGAPTIANGAIYEGNTDGMLYTFGF